MLNDNEEEFGEEEEEENWMDTWADETEPQATSELSGNFIVTMLMHVFTLLEYYSSMYMYQHVLLSFSRLSQMTE